jgi:hypothetical protein
VRSLDSERLEQALRDYFKAEVKKVEPSFQWWDNAISRLGKQKQGSLPAKPSFWKVRPYLVGLPLSVLLLVILVGSFLPMLGGMATPPPPAPEMVSDDSGGAFLVWLEKPWIRDAAIWAQHVDAQGIFLWGEKGQQMAYGKVATPYAAEDGSGGVLIAWGDSDSRNITRLGSDGDTIWTLEDFTSWSVLGMVEDGSGGAIILLSDRDYRVYAQRVNSDGLLLWGTEGVRVGTIGDSYNPRASIIKDGLGGAVIVWQEESDTDMKIRAQRVSTEGKNFWVNDGVIVASMAGAQGNNHDVIGDGMGNFFVAWDTWSATPDTDVYVQKLDEKGNTMWGEGGILVCQDRATEPYDPANMQSHPQIVSDGTGGVIVTWHDRRRIMNREVFAQRVSATGEMLWDENGIWLWNIPEDYFGTTSGILDSAITSDGAGGAIVVWTGYEGSYTSNSVIYAQRLSPDGQRLWPDEKVYRNPSFQSQGYTSIDGDGQGGVIIGSRVGESSSVSKTDSVYAQKIDSHGDRMWGERGLQIQKMSSALTVQFIATGAILATILVFIGVFRRNRMAGIFIAIMPVLLGIAGLFSVLLVIGPFGYSYSWAYVPDTVLNKAAAFIIPLAALAIGALGIGKKKVTLWVMIPVVVFCTLVAIIAGLVFVF